MDNSQHPGTTGPLGPSNSLQFAPRARDVAVLGIWNWNCVQTMSGGGRGEWRSTQYTQEQIMGGY